MNMAMENLYLVNTLQYDPELCIGCGMCSAVCPHGVFTQTNHVAELAQPERCMECGACQRNCPAGAIQVESGVGCAAAMIRAALTGGEPTCGGTDGSCCGPTISLPRACTPTHGKAQSSCCGAAAPVTTKESNASACCGSGGPGGWKATLPRAVAPAAGEDNASTCCGSAAATTGEKRHLPPAAVVPSKRAAEGLTRRRPSSKRRQCAAAPEDQSANKPWTGLQDLPLHTLRFHILSCGHGFYKKEK